MDEIDEYLSGVYFNPKRPGGFGGIQRLFQDVKDEGKFVLNRKQIRDWLIKQDAYTLHKPVQQNFKRNRVLVDGIDEQWHLLVCVDVFSKYAWVVNMISYQN